MSITRVKAEWLPDGYIRKTEIKQLDKNQSYMVDSFNDDIVSSDNTFSTNSKVTVNGAISIPDADFITITGTSIQIDCSLLGTTTKPIVLGYTKSSVSPSGSFAIEADGVKKYIIEFIGNLNSNITVLFPDIAGYSKIIINNTYSSRRNYIKLNTIDTPSDYVLMYSGDSGLVYVDSTGSGVFLAADNTFYKTLAHKTMQFSSPFTFTRPVEDNKILPVSLTASSVCTIAGQYPTVYKYGATSTTRSKGFFKFYDIIPGDVFELDLSCKIYTTSATAMDYIGLGFYISYINNSGNIKYYFNRSNAIFYDANDHFKSTKMIYTATEFGTYSFYLNKIWSNGTVADPVSIKAPLVYNVTLYRPKRPFDKLYTYTELSGVETS